MLPVTYILRSLSRRRARTAMTVLGIALAIALYTAMGAVADTMVGAFRATGLPDEVVIQQAGASNIDFSSVRRNALGYVQTLDGVAHEGGQPLVSPELILRSDVALGGAVHSVSLRGVTSAAPAVFREVQLAQGAWPAAGHTAAVGAALAEQHGLAVGDELELEGAAFTVAGVLASPGRVYDQEIWVDLDDLAAETARTGYSAFTVRALDAAAAAAMVEEVNGSRRHPVRAMSARDFYAQTGAMASAMAGIGRFVSMVLLLGALFAGMNTMYAAAAGRRREIGVLRALGYRRWAILTAFLAESLALALLGGAVGTALGLMVYFVPMDLPYLATNAIEVGAGPLIGALGVSLGVGLVGGLLPAWSAARTPVVDALR